MFHKKYSNEQEVLFTQLRKNTHILDKGLNMDPFEKGHGKIIYQKCKQLQGKITNQRILEDKAYKWTAEIIQQYETAQQTGVVPTKNYEQTKYSDKEKADFYKIIKSRTSCRNFTNEIVPDDIWNEIIEIASDAPSGCCRQPSRYYIESDKEKIILLRKNIAGSTGFSSDIPYLICVTADLRAYELIDRILPYIDVSLSVENFLLGCTINNVSTVCLNMQHASLQEQNNIKGILGIPDYEKIIIFIAAGKPKELPHKPIRIDTSWIRKK
jgi:hypothetical protein